MDLSKIFSYLLSSYSKISYINLPYWMKQVEVLRPCGRPQKLLFSRMQIDQSFTQHPLGKNFSNVLINLYAHISPVYLQGYNRILHSSQKSLAYNPTYVEVSLWPIPLGPCKFLVLVSACGVACIIYAFLKFWACYNSSCVTTDFLVLFLLLFYYI